MENRKISLLLVVLIFLSVPTLAEDLSEGTIEFSLFSIYVFPVDSEYGSGNPYISDTQLSSEHPLGFNGAQNTLTVIWNASTSTGQTLGYKLNVSCILNDTYTLKCEKNNIDFGINSCDINVGAYNYKNLNTVKCTFILANNNLINGTFNRSFQPLAFQVEIPSELGATVGKEIPLEVRVTNYGLLKTAYTINISADSSSVYIEQPILTTEEIKHGETVENQTTISFLTATETNIDVFTRPTSPEISCDCPNYRLFFDDGVCVSNICWTKKSISIKVGSMSLPEYGVGGLLQLMIISTIVFTAAIIARKKKK